MNDILNTINSVNWHSDKFGGRGREVPNLLLSLLQLDETDIDRGEQIRQSFCSTIAYSGDVDDITVVTVPVMFNLLNNVLPKNKYWLIRAFACLSFSQYDQDSQRKTLYNIMVENMTSFKAFLDHQNNVVRISIAYILSQYNNHPDLPAKWLSHRVLIEKDEEVLIELLAYLSKLLTNGRTFLSDTIAKEILVQFQPLLKSKNRVLQIEVALIHFAMQRDKIDTIAQHILENAISEIDSLVNLNLKLRGHMNSVFYSINEFRLDLYLHEILPNLSLVQIQNLLFPDT